MFLFLINKHVQTSTTNDSISILDITLTYETIIIVAPLIISILFVRYIILSAHSLNIQAKHNNYFNAYRAILSESGEIPKNMDSFKNLDQSELPNLFMFPLEVDAGKVFPKYFRWLPWSIFNMAHVVINLVPIIFYFIIIYSQFPQRQIFYLQNLINEVYYLVGIMILLVSGYFFFFKTKKTRRDLRIKRKK
jgi:hypothetical protein